MLFSLYVFIGLYLSLVNKGNKANNNIPYIRFWNLVGITIC